MTTRPHPSKTGPLHPALTRPGGDGCTPLWRGLLRLVSVAIIGAITVAIMGAVAMVLTAAPASAHAELVSSDPAQGSTVGSVPDSVTLTFTEALDRPAAVSVIAPDGTDLAEGGPDVVGDTLTQSVSGVSADDASPGRYSVSYQVVSADGHSVSGTVAFLLRGASRDEPASSAPLQEEGPREGVVIGLLGGLVLALGTVVLGLSRVAGGTRHD